VGYFDQTLALLDENKTVLDDVWDSYLQMNESEVRTALGTFLFKGDDVYKKISTLSGGEKARVSLLKLMLSGANLFLLDEPTNHLDIKSREALENALLNYEGTLMIISHDRYLINKLATKIFQLTKNNIKIFNGNYDYYIEHCSNETELSIKTEKPKVSDYKLKKQLESEKRKLKGAIDRYEKSIEQIDKDIQEKQTLLENPEISSSYTKITEITKEIELLQIKQEELLKSWEDMQNKLDSFD